MKVSDCCGAPAYSSSGDFEDSGICPDCREHCEFIEVGEDEEPDDRIETPEEFRDRMVGYQKLK